MGTPYGSTAATTLGFADALAHLRAALAAAGWEIAFEFDAGDALARPYRIVAALNRVLFDEALGFEEYAGLLLPWNFVVSDDSGRVTVAATDSRERLAPANNGLLNAVAQCADAQIATLLAGFPT